MERERTKGGEACEGVSGTRRFASGRAAARGMARGVRGSSRRSGEVARVRSQGCGGHIGQGWAGARIVLLG